MIDVAKQNAWIFHKKSAGKLIHKDFKEDIAQTYFARSGGFRGGDGGDASPPPA